MPSAIPFSEEIVYWLLFQVDFNAHPAPVARVPVAPGLAAESRTTLPPVVAKAPTTSRAQQPTASIIHSGLAQPAPTRRGSKVLNFLMFSFVCS